ncbi:MAG: amino acid permease [Armatimonadetes bacterium]|nr:amino acid permease [Armatimonadota bacterium]
MFRDLLGAECSSIPAQSSARKEATPPVAVKSKQEGVEGMSQSRQGEPHAELRREVSVWGSFMWGYADVGADVYIALGLVMAAAHGAASIAFALAGLVYIMVGLAYTELSSTYPVAGGGHFFALRGLGDFCGFIAGSALLLDYTIDIALFSVGSAGYLNFFFPAIRSSGVDMGPFHMNPIWCLESLILIGALILLNIRGIKESSLLNEIAGVADIFFESAIVVLGFVLAWRPEILLHQWQSQMPTLKEFMYGSSLAIISFVGLESISQAAQETKRPATIVPRTSISLILSVLIFATALSTLGLGLQPPDGSEPWQYFKAREGDPIAAMARIIPYVGIIAGPLAALLGFSILLISANTGVMGASRVTYSMSQLSILSGWFARIHPRFHTPARAIVTFSLIAALQTFLSFLTPRVMDTLGNLYAFGATLGYTLVFISLIKLRFSDPYSPRPYKMPLNIKVRYRGKTVDFPILGVIGMAGVLMILFEVLATHTIGRIAGPTWVLLCILYYLWFRRKSGLPVFRSRDRSWESHQVAVLTSAEEFDLLEDYKSALRERDREARAREKVGVHGRPEK